MSHITIVIILAALFVAVVCCGAITTDGNSSNLTLIAWTDRTRIYKFMDGSIRTCYLVEAYRTTELVCYDDND